MKAGLKFIQGIVTKEGRHAVCFPPVLDIGWGGRRPAVLKRSLRSQLRSYSCGLLAGLVAGCVSYHAQPLSAEKAAENLEARSLDDPGLRRFLAKNGGDAGPLWTLQDFTLAAWYYHSDMAVARAQVARTEAGITQAKERPEPVIGFAPQYTSNSGGLSPWTLGYSLDLPLETAGKRRTRTAVATAQNSSARYQLAATAWKVRNRVRLAMLSLWKTRESMKLVAQNREDQAALADLFERRYSAGEIGLAEVVPLRIAAGQGRMALDEARTQAQLAETALARSIGISAQALVGRPIDFTAVGRPPAENTPSEGQLRQWALQGRVDILAALADYAAAEASIKLEIARQYPDLNLGPGYTWDQGADRWSLGLSLTLPIFNRNRGAIARAEADRTAAAARFDSLQSGILGDLEHARADYLASRENERTAESVLAQQRHQLSSAEARLRAGETGRTEWLGSRLLYDEAASARLATLAQVQTSLGALEDAVQRPFDEPAPDHPN